VSTDGASWRQRGISGRIGTIEPVPSCKGTIASVPFNQYREGPGDLDNGPVDLWTKKAERSKGVVMRRRQGTNSATENTRDWAGLKPEGRVKRELMPLLS